MTTSPFTEDSSSLDYDLDLALQKEGLSHSDFDEIKKRLKRLPNRTELGMFGVMWSEHCCYRNSKPLLSQFPTSGPNILVGPGENAGVVDLGYGQRLAFKIESHNHPSAIEPFQGAATGVGGILRDIFTMGARPIAILNSLRFGKLNNSKNIGLLEGVVSGISHYGNCVGVPTVGGEVCFDNSYSGNPLVNAMALGLMETKDIVKSGASGVGYPVVYVGSTTGRDGMGGASFASAELSNSSLDDRPAVQVGDPFLEKGLIEACLESFKTGDVVAAQDMGAAGLTCSCSEMAANGKLGIEINLDLVPSREAGMTAYEYLLSESQERMLFIVYPGKEHTLMERFMRWGLQAAVVGRVLDSNIVRVIHENKIAAELPASALANDTPINEHKLISSPPEDILNHWKWTEDSIIKPTLDGVILNTKLKDWNNVILTLLDEPNIASKEWIYDQYDHQVQLNTLVKPGDADAAVIRLRPQNKTSDDLNNRGIAAVVDCLNRWVYLDPERGAVASVAEACRNVSCVGAKPLAVTDNLNFPSPDTSIGYWQLATACHGLSIACKAFQTPVTGGNVSLYNDTRLSDGSLQPIQPTPVVGLVGLVEDISQVIGQSWVAPGDNIWLLGVPIETSEISDERISLSGSSYLEYIHKLVTGRPPKVDLQLEILVQEFLVNCIRKNLISSAHDVSDGGIAITLAECSISSQLGIEIDIPKSYNRLDRILFGEGGARIIISISENNTSNWLQAIKDWTSSYPNAIHPQLLGSVSTTDQFTIKYDSNVLIDLSISQMKHTSSSSISRRINAE
ncbi:phosphoribosylformylglycinamidine synthase subunit PurL [Prochlorococcus sp. MIT 1341]|uniref:phosphoribosylformylglycinamidine synthase subunit PurL n=1 Tax=Prochlorococcus sp. MIT 1341 TaxID=3096221 RepID=UPI002A760CB2|nr:phosphoribosylformylglycinamidine synthase subunit PurL [Prochlorococcus sp. MIT 1341]